MAILAFCSVIMYYFNAPVYELPCYQDDFLACCIVLSLSHS